MPTIVASVGRNVGLRPMSGERWGRFQQELTSVIATAGEIVFAGRGAGTHEGRPEEAFTVIASAGDFKRIVLAAEIAVLAERYEQKEIAVTFGETTFIGPVTFTVTSELRASAE